MDERGGEPDGDRPASSKTLISPPDVDLQSQSHESIAGDSEEDRSESKSPVNRAEILRAIEVVEKDSLAISESFASLFASLRLALSEVTSNSVDHMHCFGDAAGRLQESVLDAATKGNRYINSCLRLNEEIKGLENLATQLYPLHCLSMLHVFASDHSFLFLNACLRKIVRRNVDTLDSAVNKLLRIP